jgi:hypothetical protein
MTKQSGRQDLNLRSRASEARGHSQAGPRPESSTVQVAKAFRCRNRNLLVSQQGTGAQRHRQFVSSCHWARLREHPAGIEPALPAWQAGRLPTTSWMPCRPKKVSGTLQSQKGQEFWAPESSRHLFGQTGPAVRLELTRAALRVRCAATRAPLAFRGARFQRAAKYPRQESNLVLDLRTVVCWPAHPEDRRDRRAERRRNPAVARGQVGGTSRPRQATSTRRRPSTPPPVRRSQYPSRESNPDLELRRLA